MRVMRGGAWYNRPGYLRLSTRWANPQAAAGNGVAFRIARDLDPDEPAALHLAVALPLTEVGPPVAVHGRAPQRPLGTAVQR